MEQNKSNQLQEIVFATSDAAESRQLVKLHKQGLKMVYVGYVER